MGIAQTFSTPSVWRTLGQLFRLPAVFTAMSDITMCGVVAWGLGTSSSRWPSFLLLLIASSDVASVMAVVYATFLGFRAIAGVGWAMFGTVATTTMVDLPAVERRCGGYSIAPVPA